MIHQIGRKLRQQIHYFSGELCKDMGRVASRFVEEAVFGISCSGSVRLTQIARALEEQISLHATHKRLSRNLADESLEHKIGCNVLMLGFWSKALGSALGVAYTLSGAFPMFFLVVLFFADIIYLPPFWVIMRRIYEEARRSQGSVEASV